MLTPIEDLGFSHDVEADDGEWDDLEKVYAKFTAQWYVDPNDPEWGWNVERPGYVLRSGARRKSGCWRKSSITLTRSSAAWLLEDAVSPCLASISRDLTG